MFIGHFGMGLALKRADTTLSLGLLFIAVQLSDLIYGVNLLTGVEKVSITLTTNPLTSAQYIFFPYSHSLVATLLLAGLVALVFLIVPFRSSSPKGKSALVMVSVMVIAVMSHFVLDVISHNPDMDLLGNGVYKIGLGLWNSQIADYVVEALLLLTGLWFYLRATKAKDFGGKYGLPILSAVLLILNGANTFVLYPTNAENLAVTMLGVYFVTIIIAVWLDRKRSMEKL